MGDPIVLPVGLTGWVNFKAVAVDSGGVETPDPAPIQITSSNPAFPVSSPAPGSAAVQVVGPGTTVVTATDGTFSDAIVLTAPEPPPNPVAGIRLTRV